MTKSPIKVNCFLNLSILWCAKKYLLSLENLAQSGSSSSSVVDWCKVWPTISRGIIFTNSCSNDRCPAPASVMQMVHCPLVPGPARGWSIYRSLARLLTTSHCPHRYRASVAQGLRGNYKFIFAEYLNFVSDYSRFEITLCWCKPSGGSLQMCGKAFHSFN